ncbi:hypothetical protein I7I48_12136 [Histoplasma ohiense]|nr:hypothetical protein I7I48_12136 [Histoplasma ohiense (nom. inval.)]
MREAREAANNKKKKKKERKEKTHAQQGTNFHHDSSSAWKTWYEVRTTHPSPVHPRSQNLKI